MSRWSAFSAREKALIGAMLLLAAGLVLWLGVWRPVEAGIADGWLRHSLAVERNASVKAKLAALKAMPGAPGRADADVAQAVAAATAEAGLTIDRADPQGPGRVAISIGQVRGGALLALLAKLEGDGVLVETASLSAGPVAGTVAAQITMKGAEQ